MSSLGVAKIGLGLTVAGVASLILIQYMLPIGLDSSLLFSSLLAAESVGEVMIFIGGASSLVSGVMGWKAKNRPTQAVALLGVLLAGLGIAWLLLPVGLGLAIGLGGGIPR